MAIPAPAAAAAAAAAAAPALSRLPGEGSGPLLSFPSPSAPAEWMRSSWSSFLSPKGKGSAAAPGIIGGRLPKPLSLDEEEPFEPLAVFLRLAAEGPLPGASLPGTGESPSLSAAEEPPSPVEEEGAADEAAAAALSRSPPRLNRLWAPGKIPGSGHMGNCGPAPPAGGV